MRRAATTRTFSDQITRLRQHPLVEPITDHTYAVSGGWARTFIFIPNLQGKRGILIDPSVSDQVERAYKTDYAGRFRRAIAELGLQQPNGALRRIMQTTPERIVLLRDLKGKTNAFEWAFDMSSEEHARLGLERIETLAGLIDDSGLVVDAVCATHHHIDHLGVGSQLRRLLNVKEHIPIPEPAVFKRTNRRRGDFLVESNSDGFQRLGDSQIIHDYGICIVEIDGHTKMSGYLLPDGTLIVGDLVTSANMWKRSVLYMENVSQHLDSLRRLSRIQFERLALGHGQFYVLEPDTAVVWIEENVRNVMMAMDIVMDSLDSVEAADRYLQAKGAPTTRFEYLAWAVISAYNLSDYRV
ncbi:MAG: MBL fold metallo-hydrolase [Candidatus Micrarchaeota archaeon]